MELYDREDPLGSAVKFVQHLCACLTNAHSRALKRMARLDRRLHDPGEDFDVLCNWARQYRWWKTVADDAQDLLQHLQCAEGALKLGETETFLELMMEEVEFNEVDGTQRFEFGPIFLRSAVDQTEYNDFISVLVDLNRGGAALH